MDMNAARNAFIQESFDLLEQMEESLLGYARAPSPQESVNAVFRAMHTIKGSAGLFDLDVIVAFAHAAENILDRVRGGSLPMGEPLIGLMLECHDYLKALIQGLEGGEEPDSGRGQLLVERLQACMKPPPSPPEEPSPLASRSTWHLSFKPHQDVLREGMDPIGIIRYLGTLGTLRSVDSILDLIPGDDDFDPEACYLQIEMELETEQSREAIQGAFDFVADHSRIRIIPPQATVEAYLALIRDMPEVSARLGDILVRTGALARPELERGLMAQSELEGEGRPQRLGEILVKEETVPAAVVEAALAKQKAVEEKRRESRFIKLEASRLDHLIDLVGELVISGAATSLLVRERRFEELLEATSAFTTLIEQIRSGALAMRMVQVGEILNRFPRVVRDLANSHGKEIDLRISGGDAELDKSMMEKLIDPLTHLVRNAVDHGIEPVEERERAGKLSRGTLNLHAYHESGSIVIEISDDGRGLDRARILAKALEKGLIPVEHNLTDAEIFRLIFEPGFSTAAAVTSLSGRGVGMDVVRRNIEQLRGTIDIDSQPGKGATFRLRLPLTLAIIDGFMVEAEGSKFVIPLELIKECVEMDDEVRHHHDGFISLRGEALPLVRLREALRIGASRGGRESRESIVVVAYGSRKAGIVVDALLGEFQTVIKPLGRMFSHLRTVSGSTILGNGEVALILDVGALVGRVCAEDTERHSFNRERGALRLAR